MRNKKIFFNLLAFLLLVPLNVFPANLSLLEINKTFHLLKREIVDIHLSNFINSNDYSPEEEAVIVLAKKATLSELVNLNFKELPKDFIINALLQSGLHFAGASGNPLDFIEKELLNRSIEQITSWLLQNNTNIAGGEINLFYQDINKKVISEKFLYSITRKEENRLSITIYSTKHISPPLSTPGPAISNSLWRMNELEESYLRPFAITINGETEKTSQGALYWKNNPEIKITFYKESFSVPFPTSSILEKIRNSANNFFSNIFSFFLSEENIFKSSITTMFKKNNGARHSSTVNLEDIEDIIIIEEEKEKEIVKEEEEEINEKIQPPSIKKEDTTFSRIEINSALGEELERLSGIGPIYAERIIENRPYCTLDDLIKVPGIGEVTLNKIKDQGLAYVISPNTCFKEETLDREEIIKALLAAKEALENIRKTVEERREAESEEEKEDRKEEGEEIITSIEVNSASVEELQNITGIGPSLAERIIENRPYCTLDDLIKVPGIGEVTLNKIKDQNLAYVDPPNNCNKRNSGGGNPFPPSPPEEEEEEEEDIEKVEINSASVEELQNITGIGPSLAERIIENRPYCTLDDLIKVPGIGEVTLNKIKDQGLAYVDPDESCFEDKDEEEEQNSEDNEEEEEEEEQDNENNEEEISDIIVSNAEICYHVLLLREIINSDKENKEIFDKTIVSNAEILIEKILEEYFTTNLSKPSFIN